ncbi:MAG: protein translocase subunit SecF, partial [Pseudomonadota bacterium]
MQLLPHFKGRHFIPEGTSIDFMSLRQVCFWTSIAIMIGAAALFAVNGLNYGVDFKGGTMIELRTKAADGGTAPPADIPALREAIGSLDLGDVQIQEFGQPSDVLIRVEQQSGGETAQQDALNKVLGVVGDKYVQRRVEVVGPAVSSELRTTGLIAVLASILAIITYIWLRFEWQFAIGAVLALTHDVLITVGVFSLFYLEFDLSTVAALLTILGYSVNDT